MKLPSILVIHCLDVSRGFSVCWVVSMLNLLYLAFEARDDLASVPVVVCGTLHLYISALYRKLHWLDIAFEPQDSDNETLKWLNWIQINSMYGT